MIGLFTLAFAAAPTPVAVIPLVVDGGRVSRGTVIEAVRTVQAERVTLRLISDEELFVAGSGLDQQLANCGTDPSCIATRLRATPARLAVLAIVNELVSPALVSVELVNVDVVKSMARDASRVRPEEGDVTGAIRARVSRFFDDAGHPASSRLSLRIEPDDASVVVAGTKIGNEDLTNIVVPPGPTRVEVSKDGFVPYDRELSCAAGAEENLFVALERDEDPLANPWLWAGAGAAVVVGTIIAIVVLQPGDPCICAGPPGVPCESC